MKRQPEFKVRAGPIARLAAGLAIGLTLALACSTTALADWPPDSGRGSCAVTKQVNVEAKMRDGTVLRADVYRPTTKDPVPVILMRTQYGKAAAQVAPSRYQSPDWFASHCYIVVIQDIRGQGASDGAFYEYAHDRNDGYDSVEWAARLPAVAPDDALGVGRELFALMRAHADDAERGGSAMLAAAGL